MLIKLLSVVCLFFGSTSMAMDNQIVTYDRQKSAELAQYLYWVAEATTHNRPLPDRCEVASTIKRLVEEKADPNVPSDQYFFLNTAIHIAATVGDADLIEFLWCHGANIEARCFAEYTALMYAAYHGKLDAVVKLLDLGANIEASNFNKTWRPIVGAVIGDYDDMLVKLIERGADIDKRCVNQARHNRKVENLLNPCFSEAASLPQEKDIHRMIRLEANQELESLLINTPADLLKSVIDQTNEYKLTPLDIALVTRNENAAFLLLIFGANPTKGIFNGLALASNILSWQPTANSDKDGPCLYDRLVAHYFSMLKSLPLTTDAIHYIIKWVLAPWSNRCDIGKHKLPKTTLTLTSTAGGPSQ